MNLTTISAAISKIEGVVENLDKIKQFVSEAVSLAQTTEASGATKLAGVLAAAKTFVASLTTTAELAESAWTAIHAEITAYINGVVQLWHSLGVFTSAPEGAAAAAAVAVPALAGVAADAALATASTTSP
ncbi:hypothetical protein OVY01_21525 [Robbsia sp. Bb-Pol-6]|uniref:Uncharacterized protein n=1 Tax=Robbsia betulipollinis TaxID=2981849 RepID=A0ABT3ZTC9_9BURK|nr:hypothetical protein [Robbsia betulipollinis]MCY0389727.1 hypothetical protein [Robbsia betulipollinis]